MATIISRKCQDCIHYIASDGRYGAGCMKDYDIEDGSKAQTCYRYLTDATASRRYAAQDARARTACPICSGHDCHGDCEAVNG